MKLRIIVLARKSSRKYLLFISYTSGVRATVTTKKKTFYEVNIIFFFFNSINSMTQNDFKKISTLNMYS